MPANGLGGFQFEPLRIRPLLPRQGRLLEVFSSPLPLIFRPGNSLLRVQICYICRTCFGQDGGNSLYTPRESNFEEGFWRTYHLSDVCCITCFRSLRRTDSALRIPVNAGDRTTFFGSSWTNL